MLLRSGCWCAAPRDREPDAAPALVACRALRTRRASLFMASRRRVHWPALTRPDPSLLLLSGDFTSAVKNCPRPPSPVANHRPTHQRLLLTPSSPHPHPQPHRFFRLPLSVFTPPRPDPPSPRKLGPICQHFIRFSTFTLSFLSLLSLSPFFRFLGLFFISSPCPPPHPPPPSRQPPARSSSPSRSFPF
jgi:hypothetical protein